jgi:RNase P/RNase MRP subunit p29
MKKYLFIGILLTFTLLFADSSVIFFDSNIHTGEAIKIVINKKAKKTVEAIFKKATEDFAVAKVKKTKKHIEIIVVPLNSGNLKLPDIELTIDGKKTIIKGKKEKVLPQTKPTDLRLKPIKPMKKVIEKDYRLIYLLAFILLLIFVVFIIKKFFLNRKKSLSVIQPQKTPYEIAMEYYNRAFQAFSKHNFEQFTDEITLGLKAYLEKKYNRHFLEMTTKEVNKTMKKLNISKKEEVVSLLKKGDAFKFAEENYKKTEFEKMLKDMINIIDSLEKQENKSETV